MQSHEYSYRYELLSTGSCCKRGRLGAKKKLLVAGCDRGLAELSLPHFQQRVFTAACQTIEPLEPRQLRDRLVNPRGDLRAHRTAQNEAQYPFDFAIWLHAAANREPKMFDDESGQPLSVAVLQLALRLVVVERKVPPLVFREPPHDFREDRILRAARYHAISLDRRKFRNRSIRQIGAVEMPR